MNSAHHQGDVGEASYAAVPHPVRIYHKRAVIDWKTYAIVAVIELARDERKNPEIPQWLSGYPANQACSIASGFPAIRS